MNNKKFDLIIYGDFDKSDSKYKAYGAKLYIETLEQMGALGKIICRGTSLSSDRYVPAMPFGSLVPKIFTFIQKKTGLNLRDFSQNILFDFFASKKIGNQNVLSFAQGLNKCIYETKKNNNIYIEVSVTENMEEYLEKLKKESNKFNLPVDKNICKILINGIKTAKNTDYIITISQHIKDTYTNNGYDENKIFVIEQGIDLEKIIQKSKYDSNDILIISCVAHFQILKGLHYLIKAIQELNNKNIELNIIGDLDKNSKIVINKFCENIKNFSKINYIGKVSDPYKILKESDLFILPSLSEGFGRAIAEAMAIGLPVIITKDCGIDIRDGIDGFIIDSANIDQIKEKINLFLENKNKIEEMGKNAKNRIAEICNKEKRKKKINNFFENILTI